MMDCGVESRDNCAALMGEEIVMMSFDEAMAKVIRSREYARDHAVELTGFACFFAWLFAVRTLLGAGEAIEVAASCPLRSINEILLAVFFTISMLIGHRLRLMPRWTVRAVGVVAAIATGMSCVLLSASESGMLLVGALAVGALCQALLVSLWAPKFVSQSPSVLTSGILVSIFLAHAFSSFCSVVPLYCSALAMSTLPLLSALVVAGFAVPQEDPSDVDSGLSSQRMALVAISFALLGFSFGILKGGLDRLAVDIGAMDAFACIFILAFAIVLFTVGRRRLFCNFYNMAMFALVSSGGLLGYFGVSGSEVLLSVLLPMQQIFLGIVWIISPTLRIGLVGKTRRVRLVGWAFALLLLSSSLGSVVSFYLFRGMEAGVFCTGAAMAVAGVALVVHFFLLRTEDVRVVVRDHKVEVASLQRHLEDRYGRLAAHYGLTDREKDLLLLWVQGYSAKGIADRLSISQNTVRSHIRHIYAKTMVDSRDALIELGQGF